MKLTYAQFGQSFADYQAEPYLSKSALDWFFKSPAHYRDYIDGKIQRDETEAMRWGRLAHAFILERKEDFVTRPETYPTDKGDKPWSGNATWCKEWTAAQTKPVLSKEDVLYLHQCRHVADNDAIVHSILKSTEKEVSIFGTFAGREMKGRCDAMDDYNRICVDLKTVANASTGAFSSQLYQYRWHIQAALYTELLNQIYPGEFPWRFIFIALEKSDPPRINVRELCSNAIELGRAELTVALEQLAECEASGCWPGYSEVGRIGKIDVPQWAHQKYENSLKWEGATQA